MRTIIKSLIAAFAIITLGAFFSSMPAEAIKIAYSVLCIPTLVTLTWWFNERQMKKNDETRKERFTDRQFPASYRKHPADQRSYAKKKNTMVAEEA